MKEESIVARELIGDHIFAHSLSPESFVITKPLITSCLRADTKYQEHLESMKNAKEQENISNKMKVLMEEINDAEAYRQKLVKISENLDDDFVSYAKNIEFEKDMTQASSLISKANTLKRRSEELKQDVKKLDEKIEPLKTRKRKLEYFTKCFVFR